MLAVLFEESVILYLSCFILYFGHLCKIISGIESIYRLHLHLKRCVFQPESLNCDYQERSLISLSHCNWNIGPSVLYDMV